MSKDIFKFFLYRLNKEYRQDLFSNQEVLSQKSDDEWLKEFLISICNKDFDFRRETRKAVYVWSLRNFRDIDFGLSSIVLARSQVLKTGTIVTENSLIHGQSVANPPTADTIVLLIIWDRHIVVVENRAGMTTAETWLRNFHAIVENAKIHLSIPVAPKLEPIPKKGTILEHFRRFDKIFRFRVRLKLPNPELTHWAKYIYDEMVEQQLTEYLQEFISPTGIRSDENSKAYSSAALAELGYKEGGVQIEGEIEGNIRQVDEGKKAIRGKINQIRALIRGLETNATSKQLQRALLLIKDEVNRLFPPEEI